MQQNIQSRTQTNLLGELPFNFIVNKLREKFKNHIGRENPITMPEIYNWVYDGKVTDNQYQYLVQVQRIEGAIGYLKRKTKYFIVGEQNEFGTYIWYVLKSQEECNAYKNQVDNKIKGLEVMKEKAEIAVKEKFYLDLDGKVPKKIERKFDVEA
ncbi:MAG: hypothetical protein KKC77_19625 [Proteobacteria bacterium]|nr:hypothetical protein [Pseudomonadota bacterium]